MKGKVFELRELACPPLEISVTKILFSYSHISMITFRLLKTRPTRPCGRENLGGSRACFWGCFKTGFTVAMITFYNERTTIASRKFLGIWLIPFSLYQLIKGGSIDL